jgi:PAS domain S-box-containing protein
VGFRGADDQGQERTACARLRCAETTHSEPLSIRCLDGTANTILASVSPLHGLDGRIVGAVILIRDVTEAKKSKRTSRSG